VIFFIFGFHIVLVVKKRNVNDFFGNKKYALKHFLMINIKVVGNNCFDSKKHEANHFSSLFIFCDFWIPNSFGCQKKEM
jgi:hypothetical protein